MQRNRPISLSTISKIIRGDYGAFFAFAIPVVGWLMYLFIQDTTVATVAIVFTAVCIPIAVARTFWVARILRTGEEVSAKVTFIKYYPRRDRGYMKYAYTFQDQIYENGTAIMKTEFTARLQPGDEIQVIVDLNNPKRALPKAQYIQ